MVWYFLERVRLFADDVHIWGKVGSGKERRRCLGKEVGPGGKVCVCVCVCGEKKKKKGV